jgi:CheY-like chemotaxis protein
MIEHVFERFTQADATITRQFGGTGLGLSITRRLVEAMGGEVGATSVGWAKARGSGAFCPCRSPLIAGPAPKCRPTASRRSVTPGVAGAAGRRQRGQSRVGRGDPALGRSPGRPGRQRRRGCRGRAARGEHDLVLMDVQMPLQDGVSATLRHPPPAGTGAPSVPIVALSANVLAHQIESYRACGMNDHIAKPIATGELLSKVALWGEFGRRAIGDGERATPDRAPV